MPALPSYVADEEGSLDFYTMIVQKDKLKKMIQLNN